MATLENLVEDRLIRGQYTFTKREATKALTIGTKAFLSAAERLKGKRQILSPKRGFYLILRPEDRALGAPPPERWIAPLMSYLRTDYRISLLRAAAYHGSSHQAAMVFQVIAPKQIRAIAAGRQHIQFLYQGPKVFAKTNRSEWMDHLKTDTGLANVAGIELTLLDSSRYFHKAGGISGAAQIVRDLGAKADINKLVGAAQGYENATVRRLGYLLDRFHHLAQADVLAPFAKRAKSVKPLNPAARSFSAFKYQPVRDALAAKWKLVINESLEVDT